MSGLSDQPVQAVGYKKPPIEHRFKPGQSGNPKGRPKAKPSVASLLWSQVYKPITIIQGDRRRSVPTIEVLFKKLVHSAAGGDNKALLSLLNLMRHYPDPSADADQVTAPLDEQDLKVLQNLMASPMWTG